MMNDTEILRQMITRSINNTLQQISPGLKIFSNTLVNYTMQFIEPYVLAFTNPDTNHVNTKAAEAYLKEETNKKIEDFMKRFAKENGDL